MARISEDTIAQVAAANDVVEVIGTYLQLKRAGSSWRGLCPFHQEKTPSFHVNPARQSFHCFGCGAGGSVFRFVMDYEHVEFPEAVQRLARRAGIAIQEESSEDIAKRGQRDRLLTLHREAAAWYHANLMKRAIGAPAREYLKNRGITSDVAARWQIGFAPDAWDGLASWAGQAGFTEDELVRAGLGNDRDGGGVYDRFRNRVMFPIRSDYGEVLAFSGRTLGDDPAKYVNSPETPIFTKGRVLFGLDMTKRAIIEANQAIVCEGQIDLISMFEAGISNVIAPQGTAFTARQASLVRQFAEVAVLCFDSDKAGQAAVERSLPALLSSGVTVKVARIPAGEDPDSLIRRQGADALRHLVTAAPDYFDDAVERGIALDSSPQGRATLAGQMATFLTSISDPALREGIANRVRARLEVSAAAFSKLMGSARKPQEAPPEANEPVTENIILSERTKVLYRWALGSDSVRQWMREQEVPAGALGDEFALLERVIEFEGNLNEPAGLASFCSGCSAAEERLLSELHSAKLPADPVQAAAEFWRGIMAGNVRAEIDRLNAKKRQPGLPKEEIGELNKQTLDLQSQLNELLKPFSP